MGQYIVYSRVKNYWRLIFAPVNRGRFNLDTIRHDYYLDDNVVSRRLAGAFDSRLETTLNWATRYTVKISIIRLHH